MTHRHKRSKRRAYPLVRELSRLCEADAVAAAVDAEVRAGAEPFARGRVLLTRSWLLYATVLHLSVIRLADVVWVFKRVTQHRTNGLPTGRDFELILRTSRRGTWSVCAREREVDRLLAELAVRLPGVLAGYDAELDRCWLLDPDGVIRAVEDRRGLPPA
jgi:hypothetical protein